MNGLESQAPARKESTLSYAKAVGTAQPKRVENPRHHKSENKVPRKGRKGKVGKGSEKGEGESSGGRGKDLTLKSGEIRNLPPKYP